ncbi:leucine-rich repeat-containing protein 71 isoform X2 [Solea solea]|uniref:leucine-rich repeat-containing protein 71 isoform X2 n=1 Tax=Solea solea TaxID=90069 RepID=UPI00272CF45B|nr:leucine-rich repeat-containing protein 71 isoform X2 [Solea solea]
MSRKRQAKEKAEEEKHAESPIEKVETLEDKQLRHIAVSFLSMRWLKVELENDDLLSVKSIKISGRKVDEQVVGVLQKTLPLFRQLQRLQFWQAGLTDGMVISLTNTMSLSSSLRVVILEGNPLPQQSFHCLLSEGSTLTHLSLRNNRIGDDCARLIGSALSTTRSSNKNLMSLCLAFNRIGDAGAAHIAQGLRFNHTLLFLSLANNWIEESGAANLAKILGNFALKHEEVVERRKLLLERIESGSLSSLGTDSALPNADELLKTPSSTSLNASKGEKKSSKKRASRKEEKSANKEKLRSSRKASGVKALQSKSRKTGDKEKLQSEVQSCASLTEVDSVESGNPLLDPALQHRCGQLFLPGNKTLVSLNLAGNRITEKALPLFKTALEMQKEGGLLRLCLQRNCFSENCEAHVKIQNLLAKRLERRKHAFKTQTEGGVAN